jgi:hypothetical protein
VLQLVIGYPEAGSSGAWVVSQLVRRSLTKNEEMCTILPTAILKALRGNIPNNAPKRNSRNEIYEPKLGGDRPGTRWNARWAIHRASNAHVGEMLYPQPLYVPTIVGVSASLVVEEMSRRRPI